MDSQLIIPKESKADLSSTWNIYKSQWKTFLALTGFLFAAYVIYMLIDVILSIFGFGSLSLTSYTDYESIGTGAYIISAFVRIPVYLIYSVVAALLSVLYMVIPALYFNNKEIITWKVPYIVLKKNFKRYLFAGILYSLSIGVGFVLCILPGIVISFIGPSYVNKIACSEMPIIDAFKSSFQAVFKSPNLWSYIGMQLLAGIIYIIATVCTCGIGNIVTLPMLSIYSQHLAYNKGIIN
tara:strand:- start:963 stop:1676 length:714 start_codon:yes stop_codon:yes gene_type:complete